MKIHLQLETAAIWDRQQMSKISIVVSNVAVYLLTVIFCARKVASPN
jgi:hypothetical protein